MKKHFLLCLLCLTLLMLAFISGCGKKEETTKQAKPEAVITEQNTNLSDGAECTCRTCKGSSYDTELSASW